MTDEPIVSVIIKSAAADTVSSSLHWNANVLPLGEGEGECVCVCGVFLISLAPNDSIDGPD